MSAIASRSGVRLSDRYTLEVICRMAASLKRKSDPIKVYDARWEVDDFSDAEVTRLFEATLAYGRLLGVDTVTLTRDARLGCPRLLEIGINTAVRMGFRVIACGDAISTPQGYFLALRTSARHPKTMGLAITASHNPAQYIGIKFTVPTVQAIGLDCGPLGGLTKVREIYHSDEAFPAVEGGELFLASNPTTEYVDYSLDAAGVKPGELAGLTVVLDAFHGSAGPELWHALTKVGARVVPLRLVPNGEFPTGSPNPTSQGKMDRAIQLAARKTPTSSWASMAMATASSSATAAASSRPASSPCRSFARCSKTASSRPAPRCSTIRK